MPFHVTRIVENLGLAKSDVEQSTAESAAKRGTVSIFRGLSRAATTKQSLLEDTAIDQRLDHNSTTSRTPPNHALRAVSLVAGKRQARWNVVILLAAWPPSTPS